MEKEGEVRAKDHKEALGEVPVPRVGSVEGGHILQHVKLQKVQLNQDPLQEQRSSKQTRRAL